MSTPPPHKPTVLWIGCSDARVPPQPQSADEKIFVHRNIANQFHLTDNNAVSVLTYGITGIEGNPIKEIRVVGHTDCGGVKACHSAAHGKSGLPPPDSVLWTWLGPLKELAFLHPNKPPDELAVDNVHLQVKNVKTVLGWLTTRDVEVRGYIYNVTDGKLHPV